MSYFFIFFKVHFHLTYVCVCVFVPQLPLIVDAALLPEDRDVADERKRVLECQPIIESMVGSPLVLHELSKVRSTEGFFLSKLRDKMPHCGNRLYSGCM